MSNEINLLLAQNKDFRFVRVQFEGSTKNYTYKTLDSTIEADDSVVVVDARGNHVVVTVTEVLELCDLDLATPYRFKWVVQRVDTTKYDEYVAMESLVQRELNNARTERIIENMNSRLVDSIGAEGVERVKGLVRL